MRIQHKTYKWMYEANEKSQMLQRIKTQDRLLWPFWEKTVVCLRTALHTSH